MIDIASLLGNIGIGFTPMAIVPMLLIAGLLALLCGYRLFRLFIFMVGFILGAIIIGTFAEAPIAILGGLVAGCVCCVLWYLGVFILGAALGLLIAVAIGVREQVALIIFAGVFGMLAISIRKLMIVISTSWIGANLIASAISAVLDLHDMFDQIGIAVVLTVIGIICQYTVTSGKVKATRPSPTPIPNNRDSQKSDDTPAQNAQSTMVTRGNS